MGCGAGSIFKLLRSWRGSGHSEDLDCNTATFQDFVDRGDGGIHLCVRIVEMRRKPHSRFWSPVDKNIAGEQVAVDLLRLRHIKGNSTAALLDVSRRVHLPAVLIGEFDQTGGLAC